MTFISHHYLHTILNTPLNSIITIALDLNTYSHNDIHHYDYMYLC